jgi:hypothetical protein
VYNIQLETALQWCVGFGGIACTGIFGRRSRISCSISILVQPNESLASRISTDESPRCWLRTAGYLCVHPESHAQRSTFFLADRMIDNIPELHHQLFFNLSLSLQTQWRSQELWYQMPTKITPLRNLTDVV